LLSAFKVASFKTAFEEDLEPINQPNDNDDESKDWVNIFFFNLFLNNYLKYLNINMLLLYEIVYLIFLYAL